MKNPPEFEITANCQISIAFTARGIHTFSKAAEFVKEMAYGRNADKNNLLSVLNDNCGTCSTKHALLSMLAAENRFQDIKLIIGLYKMNSSNTPEIARILLEKNLPYIPEAHCYLKFGEQRLDMTNSTSTTADFVDDLIEEIEILPEQISDFKVNYHKAYLLKWLDQNMLVNLSLHELWHIREQCIQRLADASIKNGIINNTH